MRKIRDNRGATLVEVLLGATLGMALLASVYSLHVLANRNMSVSMAMKDAINGSNRTLEQFNKDARGALAVESAHPFDGKTYQTGSGELVLSIPATDANGNNIDGSTDYVIYAVKTDQGVASLYRMVDAAANSSRSNESRVIATNVEGVTFLNAGVSLDAVSDLSDVSSLEVDLDINSGNTDRSLFVLNRTSDVKMRNH